MRFVLVLCGLALTACGGGSSNSSAPELVTLYCYETLADSACHLAPDPDHGNRLLAVVDVPLSRELALLMENE